MAHAAIDELSSLFFVCEVDSAWRGGEAPFNPKSAEGLILGKFFFLHIGDSRCTPYRPWDFSSGTYCISFFLSPNQLFLAHAGHVLSSQIEEHVKEKSGAHLYIVACVSQLLRLEVSILLIIVSIVLINSTNSIL